MRLEDLAALKFLYLTTTGRRSRMPRRIEIWFVVHQEKFYLFAEGFRRANWVRNIEADQNVKVSVGDHEFDATARILDPRHDRGLWHSVQELSREKYGWGDGLPVELSPVSIPVPTKRG